VVVGGTGLYLRRFTDGVVEIEPGDMAVRERLENELVLHGPERLWERLNQIDPSRSNQDSSNNRVRLIRALENI